MSVWVLWVPLSLALWGCAAIASDTAKASAATNQSNSSIDLLREIAGSLERPKVSDADGVTLELLSPAAYRAEIRYLASVFRQLNLAGPPVKTDGWSENIPEAEWPFMGVSYLGYACANLAKYDETSRKEALKEMRWLIDAVQTPRLSGFVTEHFGEPFGKGEFKAAVFVHGHFLNLAMRYREITGDKRYDEVVHRVAEGLAKEFESTDQTILRSYKDMWWVTDNMPALSALAAYDRVFHADHSKIRQRFIESLKTYYLDKRTGMFCTYISPPNHQQIGGPRGISMMYGLQFLGDVDADFAKQQYALSKRYLIRTGLGFAAVREYPEGVKGTGDVDSGPLIFGLGPSASGFGIAAAAMMSDWETAGQLITAATLIGRPVLRKGQLEYKAMPAVGQAVILYGKTLMLMRPRLQTTP